MADDRGSGTVPVLVALIGLVGSLGGAWIATGAKFEQKYQATLEQLHAAEARIDSLQQGLDAMRAAVANQEHAAADLAARITSINAQADSTDHRIIELHAAAARINPRAFDATRLVSPH